MDRNGVRNSNGTQNNSRRNSDRRRVSFPETQLVTGYFEPEDPFRLAVDVTTDLMRLAYIMCCYHYKQEPLERVIEQINNMSLDNARETYFELKDEIITPDMCETFEEIFRRVQFLEFNLNSCIIGDDAAASLFDMIEYYESAIRFKMNIKFGIDTRGWNAFKHYLMKSTCLTYVEIFTMKFKEKEFNTAVSGLALNTHIETFKLRNCDLENPSAAMQTLAQKLQTNNTLRELYLPNNDLKDNDIKLLCTFLKDNHTLFLLDLSNNDIKNTGAEHVFNALVSKNSNDRSLSVLILWNNNLTDEFYIPFTTFLKCNYKLEVLNLGQNELKDICVLCFEQELTENKSLLRLGMQKCSLSNFAVYVLARVIKENKTLERIDFRGNKITINGLNSFYKAMTDCRSITQVDFDLVPDDKANVPSYAQLYMKIKEFCDSNKLLRQNESSNTEENKRKNASRKISLTCQTWQRHPACAAAPRTSSGRLRSPQLSPVSSPLTSPKPTKTKNRFSITLVKEHQGTIVKQDKPSRFTVYNVQEPIKKTTGFDCPSTSCVPSTSNGFDSVIKTEDQPIDQCEDLVNQVSIKTEDAPTKIDDISMSSLDVAMRIKSVKTEDVPMTNEIDDASSRFDAEIKTKTDDVFMKNDIDDVSMSSDATVRIKSEDDSVSNSSSSSSEEEVQIKHEEDDDEMECSEEPHRRFDRFAPENIDHHNDKTIPLENTKIENISIHPAKENNSSTIKTDHVNESLIKPVELEEILNPESDEYKVNNKSAFDNSLLTEMDTSSSSCSDDINNVDDGTIVLTKKVMIIKNIRDMSERSESVGGKCVIQDNIIVNDLKNNNNNNNKIDKEESK